MTKEKIRRLCAYIEENKASLYPVENEMLAEAADHLLNGYLKMLGVILHQGEEITDAQSHLYKRIIAGTPAEEKAEGYLRMALDIEIEEYESFISEVKELPVKFRFLLDALILSCVSRQSPGQIKLVAEFAEALGINAAELRYLAAIAKAELCMDGSAYTDADELKTDSIPENVTTGYLRMLTEDGVTKNSKLTIVHPLHNTEVTEAELEKVMQADTPCVKLANVKMNLKDYRLTFTDKERVVLDGCDFAGCSTIVFYNCKEIIVQNSRFHDFDKRVVTISGEDRFDMKITNCIFENCYYRYWDYSDNWSPLGGVIYAESVKSENSVFINDCTFDRCGGMNRVKYHRSAFISNHPCRVENTRFINCWHYYDNTKTDPGNWRRTMFPEGSKAIDCVFENSADFCQKD